MNICNLLLNKRSQYKLTQDQISKLLDISRAHYTNIENGVRRPSPELAQKIGKELDFDWKLFYEKDIITAL